MLAAEWVYGSYIDEIVAMYRDTDGDGSLDATYYYLQDDLYNVVALTDVNGTIVERYTYDDFGAPTVWNEDEQNPGTWHMNTDVGGAPVSNYGNPFLFNGRRWDEVLRLYDYRTRYYNPALGRFLRMDTIGPWGDTNNFGNPYTYAGNNPWSCTDPYGRLSWDEFYDEHLSPEALTYKGQVFKGTFAGATNVIYQFGETIYHTVGGGIHAYTGWDAYAASEGPYNRIGEGLYAIGTHPIQTTENAYEGAVDAAASAMYEGNGSILGNQIGSTAAQGIVLGETVANPLARSVARAPGTTGRIGKALTTNIATLPTVETLGTSLLSPINTLARPANAGARGLGIHEQVAGEYVEAGGTYQGFTHPITDIIANSENISIRTIDLASKSYLKPMVPGRAHPLTSAITNKAWRLVDLDAPGPRVLHVELYGPKPTSTQLNAVQAAIEEVAEFESAPVAVRVRYRP